MAKKVAKKTYTVTRRISAWTETTIQAEDFDAAVAQAKELKVDDFIQTTYEGDYFVDYDFLPGFGVREEW